MNTRRSILLADDHALVRAGIRALLESLPGVEIVGETAAAPGVTRYWEEGFYPVEAPGVGIIGVRRNRRFPEAPVGDKIGQ